MKKLTEQEFDAYIDELEEDGATIFSITENEATDVEYKFDNENQVWYTATELPKSIRTVWYNCLGENQSEDIEIVFEKNF